MARFLAFTLFLAVFSCFASAGCQAATPKTPSLTFLYSCNVTLGAAIDVGAGPRGRRNVIPITGGTFSGPRLSGTDTTTSIRKAFGLSQSCLVTNARPQARSWTSEQTGPSQTARGLSARTPVISCRPTMELTSSSPPAGRRSRTARSI